RSSRQTAGTSRSTLRILPARRSIVRRGAGTAQPLAAKSPLRPLVVLCAPVPPVALTVTVATEATWPVVTGTRPVAASRRPIVAVSWAAARARAAREPPLIPPGPPPTPVEAATLPAFAPRPAPVIAALRPSFAGAPAAIEAPARPLDIAAVATSRETSAATAAVATSREPATTTAAVARAPAPAWSTVPGRTPERGPSAGPVTARPLVRAAILARIYLPATDCRARDPLDHLRSDIARD